MQQLAVNEDGDGGVNEGKLRLWLLVLMAWLCPGLALGAGPSPTHYATTPMLEADRCATAWVIRRYIEPEARFSFYERQEIPADAVLFDLPEAQLKRDARRATVEVLLESHPVQDPVAKRLAQLVHDIEITAWAREPMAESIDFERVLMDRIQAKQTAEKRLRVCFELLDAFEKARGEINVWVTNLEGSTSRPSDHLD